MSRRPRPMTAGVTVAVSTSAVGVAINIATEHQAGMFGWLAVGALTLVTGTVTGLLERARDHGDPMADIMLTIECTVRADGSSSTCVKMRGDADPGLVLSRVRPLLAPHPLHDPLEANGALHKPVSVALVTRSRSAGTARRLETLGDRLAGISGLRVSLCVDDDLHRRREILRTAQVLVLHDRCSRSGGDRPLVGGLDLGALHDAQGNGLRARVIVLGCHDGATAEHTDALRASLESPVAFLACEGAVPADHADVLYLEVMIRLAELAGARVTAAELQEALDAALFRMKMQHGQLTWNRWRTTVLAP